MIEKKYLKYLIAFLLFIIVVSFRIYLEEPYIKMINPDVEGIYDMSVNMAAVIFGETRKTIGAFLFGKVLRYHTESSHGAIYTSQDIQNGGHHSRHDANYMTEGRQTLPLARLITWFDRQFIQAYDFTGYFLAMNLNKTDEGIAFLKEGIQYNPNNYVLNQELGYIYFQKMKDYKLAIIYSKKALSIALKSNETNIYTYYNKKIDCLNSLRIIAHSYRRLGEKEKAKEYFLEIVGISPEFKPVVDKNISDMEKEEK